MTRRRSTMVERFGNTELRLFVALAIFALLCSGCEHQAPAKSGPAPQPELPVIKAAVIEVQPRTWPAIVRTQGSLIADEVTIVGAKVAGRIDEINVDLGDGVTASAPLAQLNQDEFRLQVSLSEAQLLQARAAVGLKPTDPLDRLYPEMSPPVREAQAVLDEARTRVDRIRRVQARNAVTQEELDQAVSAAEVAEARHASALNGVRETIAQIAVRTAMLSLAQQRLEDTVIKAPFDGLVQERHVGRGTFVQIGEPIVTLVRTGKLRFRGSMPERHAHRLALGENLSLRLEGVTAPQGAKVTRISPSIDESSRSLAFEAEVDNASGMLRTGLFAQAEVIVDPEAQAILIPASAVIEFAGTEKVWKVVEGVAREQIVQTAHTGEKEIEIIRGLAPGDQILLDAAQGKIARIDPLPSPESPTLTTATANPDSPTEAESAGP